MGMGYNSSNQPHGFMNDPRQKGLHNNTQINLGNELIEDVQGEQDRTPNENQFRQRISNT